MRARFAWIGCVVLLFATSPAAANGMLGVFFDEYGSTCSASVNSGGLITMYVVFLPDGDTRDGISGAEFRVEAQEAGGYNILAVQNRMSVGLGDAFANGINVAGPCTSDLAIPLLSIQIQNVGGGSNAKFVARVREDPSDPQVFPCALVTLCDAPAFTKVCVETGKAILNPSTSNPDCGSNSESAEWSRIKELYR